MNQRYGWKPDSPDTRDHLYAVSPAISLPLSVDLRPQCPPIYDQGQLGSCTANAIAGMLEFDQIRQVEHSFVPSRLFIYYNERAKEGTVNEDAGAMIRDGVKVVAKQGYCDELGWSYDISRFAVKPPAFCYAYALKFKALSYQRIQVHNLHAMKACLALSFPFVFGFLVYESFESNEVASTGVMPMPQSGEQILGGHAVMACGYDDARQALLVRNSWGIDWGLAGYFWMPYAYLTASKLTDDFWTIRSVS
jgi:C1A family cysteine protease